jgi:hypothetical protein
MNSPDQLSVDDCLTSVHAVEIHHSYILGNGSLRDPDLVFISVSQNWNMPRDKVDCLAAV